MSISLPLLKTKLYLPSARPHRVPRVRLLERLSEGLMHPLTLIAAPAGFGKTTLLSAWCATASREFSCAWVSLDEEDNDPTRFLTYLIAALQAHQANVGVIAIELLTAPQAPPKAILTLLLNELGALPTFLRYLRESLI